MSKTYKVDRSKRLPNQTLKYKPKVATTCTENGQKTYYNPSTTI